MLRRNMSGIDAIIRFTIGVLLVWVGFLSDEIIANGLISFIVGIFGILNIGSSLMRFCPVYTLARLSTVRSD